MGSSNRWSWCWMAMLAAGAAEVSAQTLRSLAQARGITIGAAYKNGGGAGTYNNTLAREFNGVVGENNMKWGSLQGTRGAFTWSDADAMINFAEQNGMKTRGHNFVWHQQSGFAANMPAQSTVQATRDTMFKIMKVHITAVMNRYRGRVDEWDIVNEAVARDSAGMRLGTGNSSSFWSLRTDAANHNWDFVDSAYSFARQADPNAFLVYNDYDCEGMGRKSDLVYGVVSRLRSRGLVDGVGLQCHFYVPGTSSGSNGGWIPAEMVQNMQRMAALGLRISLTEVDFRIPTPATTANLTAQRNAYQTLLGICLANPNCKNFYLWGFTDAYSWIPGEYPGYGAALIFDGSYNPKPAYTGLQDAFLAVTGLRRFKSRQNGPVRFRSISAVMPERDFAFDLQGRRMKTLAVWPR